VTIPALQDGAPFPSGKTRWYLSITKLEQGSIFYEQRSKMLRPGLLAAILNGNHLF
jgi:hypothetical protein